MLALGAAEKKGGPPWLLRPYVLAYDLFDVVISFAAHGRVSSVMKNKLPNNELVGYVINDKHPKSIRVACDRYFPWDHRLLLS